MFLQDPNTKRFKRTLIYFNTDTQCANFRGNILYQAKNKLFLQSAISEQLSCSHSSLFPNILSPTILSPTILSPYYLVPYYLVACYLVSCYLVSCYLVSCYLFSTFLFLCVISPSFRSLRSCSVTFPFPSVPVPLGL